MLFSRIRDAHIMQKRAELMGAGYAILKWFADPMHFAMGLFESVGIPSNCKSIRLHAFIT